MINHQRTTFGASLFLLLAAFPSNSLALTVEEAYRAIPHKQTPYEGSSSTASAEDREFLSKLFSLSDRALVARIEALQALNRDRDPQKIADYKRSTDAIQQELSLLSESSNTRGFKELLAKVVDRQRGFFTRWAEALSRGTPFLFPSGEQKSGVDPEISAASSALHQLYNELMSRFPQESTHNREAFYQHLCALDFL